MSECFRIMLLLFGCGQSAAWAGSFMTTDSGSEVFTFSPVLEQRVFSLADTSVTHRFYRLEAELTELSFPYLHASLHAGYAVVDQFDDSVTGNSDLSGYYGGLSLNSVYNLSRLFGVGAYGQYQYGEVVDGDKSPASEFRWHRLKAAAVTRLAFGESFGLGLGAGLMQYFPEQVGNGATQAKYRDYTDRFALIFIDLRVDQGGWISIEAEYGRGWQAKLGFQRYY